MKTWKWIILIVLILVVASGILYKNYNESEVGSELDLIEIDINDLKECCSYNDGGELKTCRILKEYDCSLCDSKCS